MQVDFQSSVALFSTVCTTLPPLEALTPELRALFRPIYLMKPEPVTLLKAKCAQFGFRSPGQLANRLKTIMELTKDQL